MSSLYKDLHLPMDKLGLLYVPSWGWSLEKLASFNLHLVKLQRIFGKNTMDEKTEMN